MTRPSAIVDKRKQCGANPYQLPNDTCFQARSSIVTPVKAVMYNEWLVHMLQRISAGGGTGGTAMDDPSTATSSASTSTSTSTRGQEAGVGAWGGASASTEGGGGGGADAFDIDRDLLDMYQMTAGREDAAADILHYCDNVYAPVNQLLLQMHCGCEFS